MKNVKAAGVNDLYVKQKTLLQAMKIGSRSSSTNATKKDTKAMKKSKVFALMKYGRPRSLQVSPTNFELLSSVQTIRNTHFPSDNKH